MIKTFKILKFHTKCFFITDLDNNFTLPRKLKTLETHLDFILKLKETIMNEKEILSLIRKIVLLKQKGKEVDELVEKII